MRLLAVLLLPLALQSPAADPGYAGFAMKLPAPVREQLHERLSEPPEPLARLSAADQRLLRDVMRRALRG